MKIDKAIEILNHEITGRGYAYDSDTNDAIKLGIEAMKLVDQLRFDGSPYYPKELPSETPTEEEPKRR